MMDINNGLRSSRFGDSMAKLHGNAPVYSSPVGAAPQVERGSSNIPLVHLFVLHINGSRQVERLRMVHETDLINSRQ